MFFSSISAFKTIERFDPFRMKSEVTCDSKSPLRSLRTAKQRVDATCSSPSKRIDLSPKSEQKHDQQVLHVKSSDYPLRIVAIGVAVASSVEQILDP